MTLRIIARLRYNKLKELLKEPEIILITGARQVGKTTLMRKLEQELQIQGEQTIFLNLDIEADSRYFESQAKLIKKLELDCSKDKAYVFIDEIQRKENAGLFLKGLYDMKLNYKFIVSGSGSLELKEKISESLAGRKRSIELRPVSFVEFLNFKTEYKYENKLGSFFEIETEKAKLLLQEYLNFGGYPKVVTSTSLEEKQRAIAEIYTSYLDKDIKALLNLERPDAYTKMIRILAAQLGQTLNYSELASQTGLATETLKKYLDYAEKTFAIQIISPYFKNKTKEITKSPEVYFNDIGLRNYTIDEFGSITNETEYSFLFENLILDILKENNLNSSREIHFWRTTDKAEVDFIIDSAKTVVPVEVKYSHYQKAKIPSSLKSFIKKYKPKEAWLINLGLREELEYENCKVRFITLADLLT
ncbi:MAG: ATP-binding protein [Candidatus Melainabacteria bacterium]|jgi:uncharacterized protein|nr:ATP-binding protein [Candidatus Melainabacteria bacterium]